MMVSNVHSKRKFFKTYLAIILAVAMMTSIPSIGSAQDQGYTIKVETTNLSARGDAMISGNHMVWTATVDKKMQIFYRNLKTGTEKQLTTGDMSKIKLDPQVSDDENGNVYVVWLDGNIGRVWGMALTDKQERLLSSSSYVEGPLSIDGNQVVWSDKKYNSYYYSFLTAKEERIGFADKPKISNNKIVYVDSAGGGIVLYDMPSKQSYLSSTDKAVISSDLKFNGRYAIFRQNYGSKINFGLVDFSNPLSPIYTELTEFKDQILWVNNLFIGDRYAAWIQEDINGSPHLMGVNLATKEQFSIGVVDDPRQVMYFIGDGIAIKGEDNQIAIHRIVAKNTSKPEETKTPAPAVKLEPVTVNIPYSVPSRALEVAVQGEHLVWLEPAGMRNTNVYYMNLRTGESKRITWQDEVRRDVAVSEDYIAWSQYDRAMNVEFWEPYVHYYNKQGGAWRLFGNNMVSDLRISGDNLIAYSEANNQKYYHFIDLVVDESAVINSEFYPIVKDGMMVWGKNKIREAGNGEKVDGQPLLWREVSESGLMEMYLVDKMEDSGRIVTTLVSSGKDIGEPYIGDTLGFWRETSGGKTVWSGIHLTDGRKFQMSYSSSEQLVGVWGDMLVFRQGSKLTGKTIKHLVPKFEPKQEPIMVKISGEEMVFSDQAQPYITAGTTMVPFRPVFERLGLEIKWNNKDQSITGSSKAFNIKLKIGSRDAVVNGKAVQLAAAPALVNGNTMVPLRFIGEATSFEVIWDANLHAVYLAEKNSMGKLYHPNGKLKYEGQLLNGKMHGKGKLYSEQEELLFDTEFVNGKMKGIGTKYLNDGHKVVGEIEDGFGHGQTKYILANGLVWYEGEERNGLKDGYGKEYSYIDGALEYEGEWEGNERNGFGKLYHNNGNIQYEGYFKDGKYHGHGKIYNRDGTLDYEGEYVNGSRKKDE